MKSSMIKFAKLFAVMLAVVLLSVSYASALPTQLQPGERLMPFTNSFTCDATGFPVPPYQPSSCLNMQPGCINCAYITPIVSSGDVYLDNNYMIPIGTTGGGLYEPNRVFLPTTPTYYSKQTKPLEDWFAELTIWVPAGGFICGIQSGEYKQSIQLLSEYSQYIVPDMQNLHGQSHGFIKITPQLSGYSSVLINDIRLDNEKIMIEYIKDKVYSPTQSRYYSPLSARSSSQINYPAVFSVGTGSHNIILIGTATDNNDNSVQVCYYGSATIAECETYDLAATMSATCGGILQITSSDSSAVGADVTVTPMSGSGSYTGQITASGLTFSNLAPGSYKVLTAKSGYVDSTYYVSITSGQTTNLDISLQQMGTLTVTSSPPGANVYGDNILQGITDQNTGIFTIMLAPGVHSNLKVTKSGYADFTMPFVTITSGQTTYVNANLPLLTGTLSVISTPSGANVYVDDILQGTTSSKSTASSSSSAASTALNIILQQGQHTVKLTKAGYEDYVDSIIIVAGQPFNMNAIMFPACNDGTLVPEEQCDGNQFGTQTCQTQDFDGGNLICAPNCQIDTSGCYNFGSLSITSTPSGANVCVDDNCFGTTPAIGLGSAPGTYTIKLTLAGYDEYTDTITVLSGDAIDYHATLTQSSTCTDSDGGSNIFVKGTTTDDDESAVDVCSAITPNRLLEWSCDGNNVLGNYIDCPGSCQDGACLPSTCIDSDNGLDFYTKGSCKSANYDLVDTCQNSQYLGEDYCSSETNQCEIESYLCPNGCQDGACLGMSSKPSQISNTASQNLNGILTMKVQKKGSWIDYRTVADGVQISVDSASNLSLADLWNQAGGFVPTEAGDYRALIEFKTGRTLSTVLNGTYEFTVEETETSSLLNSAVNFFKALLTAPPLTTTLAGKLFAPVSANTNQSGSLNVNSTPSATIYVDGMQKGITPKLINNLTTGNHTAKLTRTGYYNYTKIIQINAGKTTSLNATLLRVRGNLAVNSNPQNATLYIDNISRGSTPKTVSLTYGNHQIKLTKPGYTQYMTTTFISGDNTTILNVVLTPVNQTVINISSNTSATNVTTNSTTNNTAVNTTTSTGTNATNTKSNATNATTVNSTASNVTYKVSSKTSMPINTTQSGSLNLGSTPSATIYIDGVQNGVTPKLISNLAIGNHTVKLERVGFYNYTRTVNINSSQTIALNITLLRIRGSLTVNTNPANASLYIDNNSRGLTPRTNSLTYGNHQIQLTKNGYQKYTAPVFISGNNTFVLNINLVKINQTQVNQTGNTTPVANTTSNTTTGKTNATGTNATFSSKVNISQLGSLNISSSPSSAGIYIDGIGKGFTPKIVNITAGNHTVTLARAGYYNYTTNIYVSAGQTVYKNATLIPMQGSLTVNTNPINASLYVDNIARGSTPRTIFSLTYGNHQIKLTKQGYQQYITSIFISGGSTTVLNVTLVPVNQTTNTTTTVIITSSNTTSTAGTNTTSGTNTTPNTTSVQTNTTNSTTTVSNTTATNSNATNASTTNTTNTITNTTSNATVTNTTQTVQKSNLTVYSIPTNATVYLNNTYKGQTPVTVYNITAGSYIVKLTKSGYPNYTANIQIASSQSAVLNAVLNSTS